MPRAVNRLSARQVATLKEPGMHADGAGLYLRVTKAGTRSWAFVYQFPNRREMGLGAVPAVSLAQAREKAGAARALVAAGIDPLAQPVAPVAAVTPTFGDYADEIVAELEPGWRNDKHRQQWRNTLKTHAKSLRPLRVDEIATEHVLAVLKPLWLKKHETADRLRGRIERILSAARANNIIKPPYENPARWKGHLEHLLPKFDPAKRGHFAALPYADMPAFMARLRAIPGVSARALEWTILTAGRTKMTRGARPEEFADGVWTVPGERMKNGREHSIPLCERAGEIAAEMDAEPGAFLFPGRGGKMLSDGSMERVLDRMKVAVTVHGFRSTFKDWAGDCTGYADELSEEVLAHNVGSKVRRAYRRGEALEKRAAILRDWEAFCAGSPLVGNVVRLRG